MLKWLSGMLLCAASLSAQQVQPSLILTNAGPLSCGLRVYQPGQVQTYCQLNQPPAPVATLCNTLDTIIPMAAVPPVAGSQSCFATVPDASPVIAGGTGNVYEVTWLVYIAKPPTTSGYLAYQIAATTQPCTWAYAPPNTDGTVSLVCKQIPTPTTVTQQGYLYSGIQSNIVGSVWHGDSTAPGIAILASDDFAQSVGASTCRITSTLGGLADWLITPTGLAVSWLPDTWCPGGISPPLEVYGCPLEPMLAVSIVPGETPACSASPQDPSVLLAQVYLGN